MGWCEKCSNSDTAMEVNNDTRTRKSSVVIVWDQFILKILKFLVFLNAD